MLFSHPVYQYLQQRYPLNGHALHWEPDVMPGDAQWRELQSLAGPGALFVWEAQPTAEISERMDAMGLKWVVLDPGAGGGVDDWLALQQANVAALQASAVPPGT